MPLLSEERPPLHMIKTEDAGGIVTMCGRRARPYHSVFAEANGNCIVCIRATDTQRGPTCKDCKRRINAKKKSNVSNSLKR